MKRPEKNGDMLLSQFKAGLETADRISDLRNGLIGKQAKIDGPFGAKDLVYADYVASGRALMQIERFVLEEVLPYYANSHTEASYCGQRMTRFRREARTLIAAACKAGDDYAVIFTGSGATAGINRLVALFGADQAAQDKRIRVIIGPYEHHSNILPWRESGAEVVEITEAETGGPDLTQFAARLAETRDFDVVICAFSAASNVTGIMTDVAAVTRMAKDAGALMIWDYAGGGPYLPISVHPAADLAIDAIVVSPHKFIGGPAASGVLILRRAAAQRRTPTWPGGGTVRFVSPSVHDYSDSIEVREEAGTPNVVGDIRASLAFIVKDVIGDSYMRERNNALVRRTLDAWRDLKNLELLGSLTAPRLPIFSFRIRDNNDGYIHQQLITRMLSDRFGIQARGGCACAGPYVHRLLDIDEQESTEMRQAILAGNEIVKPGFIRLNFSVLLSDAEVDFILSSVAQLANDATRYLSAYDFDPARAVFYPHTAFLREDMPSIPG